MAKTTFGGYIRQTGANKNNTTATPAPLVACLVFSFDPTAASAGTGTILPKGAIPLYVQNLDGGATGGTDPTVDIGTAADSDGFAAELDADARGAPAATGALLGVTLTADTEVYAGVGASAGTGGTVTAAIYYVMED